MTGRRPSRAGYVLVEALATLTLSALVIAALASLVALQLRSADRASALLDAHEHQLRPLDAVAREIAGAVRARWAADNSQTFIFNGLADRILFVERVGSPGRSELRAVAFQNEATDAGNRLLRAEARVPPGAMTLDDLHFSPSVAVDTSPYQYRFSFVLPATAGQETVNPTWTDAGKLPQAIYVSLYNPGRRVAVAMIRAPLPIEAEPACVVRKDKGFCSLEGGDKPASPDGGQDTTAPADNPSPGAPR
ncbi:hypothetical protein [Oryzibacter oryziterrae]|uniref:hypothetical protein n=1 Tax=Oryzibacter oryziterrae TaxID=2766474 RepID=UPI001F349A05|nr:hypothetical protein [Oryzibacter oryziterrae]